MRRFSSFVPLAAFMNFHGTHSGIRGNPIEDISEGVVRPEDAWHDGTSEGKEHLDTLLSYLHNGVKRHTESMQMLGANYNHEHYKEHGVTHPNDLHEAIVAKRESGHLTDNMKKQLHNYTVGSHSINAYLLGDSGYDHYSKELNNKAQHIDQAIAGVKFDKPTVTFHGTKINMEPYLDEGAPIHSKGYLSTSLNPRIASNFGYGSIIAFHAPKGHTMFPFAQHETDFPSEYETLHPRGMLFKPKASVMVRASDNYSAPKNIISAKILDVLPGKLKE